MSVLEFENEKVLSSGQEWHISDILSMNFSLKLEGNSTVYFSIKKPKSHDGLLKEFSVFFFKIFILALSVVLIAQFSALIAIIFGLVLLNSIVPYYWKIYKTCHQNGILKFEFPDAVEFVKFQKKIWENERGKKLIRHRFVLGQASEELFFVFLPSKLYNSDKFRHYIRFFTQVIYPIIVIIIPLFIGFTLLIAKNTKTIYKILKKDKFVKMVLFIAEESAEFIEDAADDYKYTKLIWDFLENLFDKLGD